MTHNPIIQEVKQYKTEDGVLHNSKSEAERHNLALEFTSILIKQGHVNNGDVKRIAKTVVDNIYNSSFNVFIDKIRRQRKKDGERVAE